MKHDMSVAGAGRRDAARHVEEAIASRRSLRGFLSTPVDRAVVERILEVSARAPSGTNMQPWRVHVLVGEPKRRLSEALVEAFDRPGHADHEYRYYPAEFFEPYLSRRRKVGWDLYTLLGIKRGESERMHLQHARNFHFFDAPVGMIFTIDRRLEIGSWLDYGMFLENIMVAARGHGLDTCPQAAFAPLHKVIRDHLPIGPEEVVVCGMALGHADPDRIENSLETERAALDAFAAFHGFDADEPAAR